MTQSAFQKNCSHISVEQTFVCSLGAARRCRREGTAHRAVATEGGGHRRSSCDRSCSDKIFSLPDGNSRSNPRRWASRWQVSGANPSKCLLTNVQTLRTSERCRSILSDQLSTAASRFHNSFS